MMMPAALLLTLVADVGASLPTIKEEEARPPLDEPSSSSSLAGAAALGRHEPQHASASHGRELQSSGCLCEDTCTYSGYNAASDGWCQDGRPGSESVSYTHLTLPTKA